ncbi:hypothetical protein [Clostridium sp. AN503]|uniref:hypothetical protein n=1 Tax=Clostridium sp. AN503 TaxID=3160598 RepID=UPI00345AD9A2
MNRIFRARTIAQYNIKKWLEVNFYAGSLTVNPIGDTDVLIVDSSGNSAIVKYEDGNIYLKDDDSPGAATPRESR